MTVASAVRRFASDDRGSVLPIVGLCLTVILGFAAIAVDLGQQSAVRTQLEATADAAALAAAGALPDTYKARAKAKDYAEKNMPQAQNGEVLADSDIVVGTWYAETRTFTPNGPVANAVQVTVRRSTANHNALPTFFMFLFGKDHVDLAAQAMAGIVLLDSDIHGGGGPLSEEDRAKIAEMNKALRKEFMRRLKAAGRDAKSVIKAADAADYLLEQFGHPVLLQ
jgi:Flp pilus assembly protein TadG